MKYTKFVIKKFKWIDDLEVNLSKYPIWNIFPIVWLNESWKTTFLEAINFLQRKIEQDDKHKLIHKKDKWSFTWDIEVEAIIELDDDDKKKIETFLKNKWLDLESKRGRKIKFIKKINFSNWEPSDNTIITDLFLEPVLKVKSSSRAKIYNELEESILNELKEDLKIRLPKILYFPDFLFDFPEKIYLSIPWNAWFDEKEIEKQNVYRNIIQDILFSINKSYQINSLLTKLEDSIKWNDWARESSKQTIRDIEAKLNRFIVDPWQQIFVWSPDKSIEISNDKDTIWHYIKIEIRECWTTFWLNERSLWFKWFFWFLFSTIFRNARENEFWETLFLFDEPANNLHQWSQKKLLNKFLEISEKAKIIYTTHSHYLLDTKLLLNTFVAKDKWRENEDSYNYRQNIKVIPYSKYVWEEWNDSSEFQPILNILEYIENPFVPSWDIVFFEWKYDYYTFKYLNEVIFNNKFKFNFYPGAWVWKYENILREYLVNNRRFIAVFDADWDLTKNEDKWKYWQKYYIDNISHELKKYVFTLKDVDNNFDTFTTEKLFSDEDIIKIQQYRFPTSISYKKKEFNVSIQQLLLDNKDIELSKETKDNFQKVFKFIKQKFTEL